jgi:hypothetical protein
MRSKLEMVVEVASDIDQSNSASDLGYDSYDSVDSRRWSRSESSSSSSSSVEDDEEKSNDVARLDEGWEEFNRHLRHENRLHGMPHSEFDLDSLLCRMPSHLLGPLAPDGLATTWGAPSHSSVSEEEKASDMRPARQIDRGRTVQWLGESHRLRDDVDAAITEDDFRALMRSMATEHASGERNEPSPRIDRGRTVQWLGESHRLRDDVDGSITDDDFRALMRSMATEHASEVSDGDESRDLVRDISRQRALLVSGASSGSASGSGSEPSSLSDSSGNAGGSYHRRRRRATNRHQSRRRDHEYIYEYT